MTSSAKGFPNLVLAADACGIRLRSMAVAREFGRQPVAMAQAAPASPKTAAPQTPGVTPIPRGLLPALPGILGTLPGILPISPGIAGISRGILPILLRIPGAFRGILPVFLRLPGVFPGVTPLFQSQFWAEKAENRPFCPIYPPHTDKVTQPLCEKG